MTRGGNEGREQFWREVIREQEASGMPISAFCKKRNVSTASYFSWRRRLSQPDQNDTAAKFVPLELVPPAMTTRPGCEVVLPDGCRIIVSRQCDANWLREILEALQGSSC